MAQHSFPDINVWFALAVAGHPHHGPAIAWWEEELSLAGVSRLTQLGLLRLLATASEGCFPCWEHILICVHCADRFAFS